MLGGIPDVAALSSPLNQSVNTHKVLALSAWPSKGATIVGLPPCLPDRDLM